jgi:hypothetical protein
MTRPGPNAVMACPSESRRRSHAAHGVVCPVCSPTEERRDRCPACGCRVPVVGVVVQPHTARQRGWIVDCAGAGMQLPTTPAVERPLSFYRRPPVRRSRSIVLVGGVA